MTRASCLSVPATRATRSARPALNFEHEELPRSEPEPEIIPWYRLPAVVMIATAVALLLVGIAVAIGLSSATSRRRRRRA